MDDFSVALALEQGGQAEIAAQNALDVSLGSAPLGAVDPNKQVSYTGVVLAATAIGALLWVLRR